MNTDDTSGIRLKTTIHAMGDDVPPVDAAELASEVEREPEPLLPPRKRSIFARLLLGAILAWLGVQWLQGIFWGLTISPWLGGGIGLLGGLFAVGFATVAWQARRASKRLDRLERIRMRFADTEGYDAATFDAPDTADRLRQIYRSSRLRAELEVHLEVVDAGWQADETADRLEQFYAPLDAEARLLVRRESVRTGLFIAASPYPALDLLLVAWRNVAMVERIAGCYGLSLSAPARWHLYQLILRNIAFVTVTETMLDSVSQSWLSNILMQVGARAGQGVGVALYSVRIGHQAMRLCRAVPERQPLVDRNIGKMVIEAVRERARG